MEIVLFIFEIIGTIAFAVSGAFVAIKAKFDIFGVVVIGCVTAFGGGIMRDTLIGSFPPAVFSKGYLAAIAAIGSVVVFVVSYFARNKFYDLSAGIDKINNFFDAIGLASFTIMGTEEAFVHGFSSNGFLIVTVGVMTGVGGGVLRDVLTENLPYIFKKHVYAIASICGALAYYFLRPVQAVAAAFVGITLIILIRLLATIFRWSLPKIELGEKDCSKYETEGEKKDL